MDGFKVIDYKFSEDRAVQHQLFVKEHSIRNHTEDKPAGRTLFVLNVPPYATHKSLKRVFSVAGPVKNVILYDDIKQSLEQSNRLCYKVAYVVFTKSSDLQKALKLNTIGPFSTKEQPISLGLKKWIQEYNSGVMDKKKLSEYCKQTINIYDKKKQKAEKGIEAVDDEGWTVVTKNSRHSGLARTEKNIVRANAKKEKGLKDFYTFQIRDNKVNEIAALRKKHEEDKKRIESIKKSRKFKPY